MSRDTDARIRSCILRRRRRFVEASLVTTGLCMASCVVHKPGNVRVSLPESDASNDPCAAHVAAFDDALSAFAKYDAMEPRWSGATCDVLAGRFRALHDKGCSSSEALFNAGLVYERCRRLDDAIAAYKDLLQRSPSFRPARLRIALCEMRRSGEEGVALAIRELEQLREEMPQDPSVRVMLTWALMRRGQSIDSEADLARAEQLIVEALMLDENEPQVLHAQVALQLLRAQRNAGTMSRTLSTGLLPTKISPLVGDLLVDTCMHAVSKAPSYAPLLEACGVVHAELGDMRAASRSFAEARELAPRRFSAHLNYAATRLLVRDFPSAREAFRQALELEPNDLEALLGLTTAIRHDPASTPEELDQAAALLSKGQEKPLEIERVFNLALLTWARAKFMLNVEESLDAGGQASVLMAEYLRRSRDAQQYRDAVTIAEELRADVRARICLLLEAPRLP